VCFCLTFVEWTTTIILLCQSLKSWWLADKSSTHWLDVERWRRLCAGDEETPPSRNICTEDGVKVMGPRCGVHCLLWQGLHLLWSALVARPNSWPEESWWPEETWWPETYLGGAPSRLGVALAYQYHGKKLICWVCIFLTNFFMFPHFILAICVTLLS